MLCYVMSCAIRKVSEVVLYPYNFPEGKQNAHTQQLFLEACLIRGLNFTWYLALYTWYPSTVCMYGHDLHYQSIDQPA